MLDLKDMTDKEVKRMHEVRLKGDDQCVTFDFPVYILLLKCLIFEFLGN